jgi:hypothetical protein
MLFIEFTNTQPFRAGLLRILVNCNCLPIGRLLAYLVDPLAEWRRRQQQQQQLDPFGTGKLQDHIRPQLKQSGGDFNAAVWLTIFYFLLCAASRIYGAIIMWPCNGGTSVCDPWLNTFFGPYSFFSESVRLDMRIFNGL